MLHLKTKCENKSRSVFLATRTMARKWIYLRVEWQGRCLLIVISTHIAELIVFAFSDNLSAENSKFSAESGIHICWPYILKSVFRGFRYLQKFWMYVHIWPELLQNISGSQGERGKEGSGSTIHDKQVKREKTRMAKAYQNRSQGNPQNRICF